VYGLTGISARDWALLTVLGLAVYLICRGTFLEAIVKPRVWQRGLLTLAAGSFVLILTLIRYGDWTVDPRRIIARLAAVSVAFGIAISTIFFVELLIRVGVRVLTRTLSHVQVPARAAPSGALAISLIGLIVLGTGGLEVVKRASEPANVIRFYQGSRLLAAYPMPGNVADIAMAGDREGYLSLKEGEIWHFRLPDPPDGDLSLTRVAEGLNDPRGLAIVGHQLFVAELGQLPCPQTYEFCDGTVVSRSPVEGELEILRSSRGDVLAFDMEDSGALTDKRVILGDLPVATSWHGVNGLTVGPDGFLYLTIGGVDLSWSDPRSLEELNRPNLDLLGTVVRISPDGKDVEVFARGIRNVYGIDFDDQGDLYGADNDGPTIGGPRKEELLQIRHGANYGYPFEGPHKVRTDPPLWIMQTHGSAGIAWRGRFGLSPGVLTGSCSRIISVRMTDLNGGFRVSEAAEVSVLMDQIEGCVTAIEPVGDHRALVGVFNWCIWCADPPTEPHPLLLIDLSGVR